MSTIFGLNLQCKIELGGFWFLENRKKKNPKHLSSEFFKIQLGRKGIHGKSENKMTKYCYCIPISCSAMLYKYCPGHHRDVIKIQHLILFIFLLLEQDVNIESKGILTLL